MNRLTDAWFEFKGVNSNDLGILLRKMPQRGLAAMNYETKRIPGRSGSLLVTDGTYGDITVKLEFDARDESKLAAIHGLLSGRGPLRFSDEPDLVYDAWIDKAPSRQSIRPRFTGQRFTVTFTCNPLRRKYATERQIQITTNGYAFSNPGTAAARPRIYVTGSGTFALTIGDQTMNFSGVEEGVIIDSELYDVFALKGGDLANDKVVSGEPFILEPGEHAVSWSPTANITRVVIEPRWRYL